MEYDNVLSKGCKDTHVLGVILKDIRETKKKHKAQYDHQRYQKMIESKKPTILSG